MIIETMNSNTKRLVKDVCQIMKNPLEKNGIFYKHDDENINFGYCMIIGSENTPYENGYYFFQLDFSNNYPVNTPKVKFFNNDKETRFHPNLYRNGKVCLSILNTWQGEQWTSCQNISSVLLTIASVMNEKPLLNEPGISERHKDFNKFNNAITYKNLERSLVNNLLVYEPNNIFCICFRENMIQNFNDNIEKIEKQIEAMKDCDGEQYSVSIYSFTSTVDYEKLSNDFLLIKNLYLKLK